jgi:hypothetical protein
VLCRVPVGEPGDVAAASDLALQGVRRNDMRKWILGLSAVVALTGGTLMAATLGNLAGQSCGDFSGVWHFVNNQTGGAPQGTLTATWSSGETCTVLASKVLSSTQHFYCTASGTLLSASTNLPGKLVLSDFACEDTKCVPDPKDPKSCT